MNQLENYISPAPRALDVSISRERIKKKLSFRKHNIAFHVCGSLLHAFDFYYDIYLTIEEWYKNGFTGYLWFLFSFGIGPAICISVLSFITYWTDDREKLTHWGPTPASKTWTLFRWACHFPPFLIAPLARVENLVRLGLRCKSAANHGFITGPSGLKTDFKKLQKEERLVTFFQYLEYPFETSPQLWLKMHKTCQIIISGQSLLDVYGVWHLVFLVLGVVSCAWRQTTNRKSQNLSSDKEKNVGIRDTAYLFCLYFLLMGTWFLQLGMLSATSLMATGIFCATHCLAVLFALVIYCIKYQDNNWRSGWNRTKDVFSSIVVIFSSLFSMLPFLESWVISIVIAAMISTPLVIWLQFTSLIVSIIIRVLLYRSHQLYSDKQGSKSTRERSFRVQVDDEAGQNNNDQGAAPGACRDGVRRRRLPAKESETSLLLEDNENAVEKKVEDIIKGNKRLVWLSTNTSDGENKVKEIVRFLIFEKETLDDDGYLVSPLAYVAPGVKSKTATKNFKIARSLAPFATEGPGIKYPVTLPSRRPCGYSMNDLQMATALFCLCKDDKRDDMKNILRHLYDHVNVGLSSTQLSYFRAFLWLCRHYRKDDRIQILELFVMKALDKITSDNLRMCLGDDLLNALEYISELSVENSNNAFTGEIASAILTILSRQPPDDKDSKGSKAGYQCSLLNVVTVLLDKDVDVNIRDFRDISSSPLLQLFRYYSKEDLYVIVNLLIKRGARITKKDSQGYTPLHLVCKYYPHDNLYSIVELLGSKSADVYTKNRLHMEESSISSLLKNFEGDNLIQILELMLRIGRAQINPAAHLNCGRSALYWLCKHYKKSNLVGMLRSLIGNGADVNEADTKKRTPLLCLCGKYGEDNLIEIVQLLVNNEANVNVVDMKGKTPLLKLFDNYKNDNIDEIVKLLIEKGASVCSKDAAGVSPLLALCKNYTKDNLLEIARLIIQKGGSCNEADSKGRTPLTMLFRITSKYKNGDIVEIVKMFIESGANVNVVDRKGWTPLLTLCADYYGEKKKEIIELLIAHGASWNVTGPEGETPLLELGDELVPFLESGVDLNVQDLKGRTLLLNLCENYNGKSLKKHIQLLIDHGVDLSAKDSEGKNALFLLCANYKKSNLLNIVHLLVSNGADVDSKDSRGSSPLLELCKNYKRSNLKEIVRYFVVDKEADVNAMKSDGSTPLLQLCKHCDSDNLLEIVQLLIKNGARVTPFILNAILLALCKRCQKYDDMTAAIKFFVELNHDMSREGHIASKVGTLLRKYHDKNDSDTLCKRFSDVYDENENTKNEEKVRLLLENWADTNPADLKGVTPLLKLSAHNICGKTLEEIVHLLVMLGVDLNAVDPEGLLPLFTDQSVLLLEEHDVNENHKNSKDRAPFLDLKQLRISYNEDTVVLLLKEHGINVNHKNWKGRTPLLNLCEKHDSNNLLRIVQSLIYLGADLTATDLESKNALLLLCANYNRSNLLEIVHLLVDSGADVNEKDLEGSTVLLELCKNCKRDNLLDILRLLVAKGASVTPFILRTLLLELCRRCKNWDMIDEIQFFVKLNHDLSKDDPFVSKAGALLLIVDHDRDTLCKSLRALYEEEKNKPNGVPIDNQ